MWKPSEQYLTTILAPEACHRTLNVHVVAAPPTDLYQITSIAIVTHSQTTETPRAIYSVILDCSDDDSFKFMC